MQKSLTVNSIYNIFYRLVSALYPLIAVTYVSHVLMSERLGTVSYAQNITSYFVVLAALGIPTYGTRETAKCANDLQFRSKLFFELFLINGISTILAVVLYTILVFSVTKFFNYIILYLVTGLQIALNVINVDWFYQGMEEYKYISIRSVIVKITSLVLLPFFVRSPSDYVNYALLYCLAIAGNNIFNIIRIRKYIGKPSVKLDISKHLRPIMVLFVASLAVELYVMIDTTMLGVFCNDSIVGCYSNAMKLTRTVNTMAAAIGAVLLPRLSVIFANKNHDQFNNLVNKGIQIMLMVAIPASVGIIILSEEIVLVLFGTSFLDSIPILRILAMMIPIVVCNTLMGGQVLITTNMESKYVISVIIASVTNIILNALFIPRFGAVSAAFASLIAEAIDLMLYLYFARCYVRIGMSINFVRSIVIPLIIYAVFSTVVLSKYHMGNLISLIVNVITCLIIYFGIGLFMKNEAMIFTYKKILSLKNKRA